MMGNPLSLSKAEHIELIAGNTDVEAHDCAPTQFRPEDIYLIEHESVRDGVFEIGGANLPWEYNDAICVEIPAEPVAYKRHENLNYSDSSAPIAMNEFEVPDSELVDYNELESALLPDLKKHFYRTAASLSALDVAAEHVEAALRTGLGVELEMDEALQSAFVPISRLDAISQIVKNTSLTQAQQDSYIEKLTLLVAEKTMTVMDTFDRGVVARRAIEMAKELNHARIHPTQEDSGTLSSSPMGVRGSRR